MIIMFLFSLVLIVTGDSVKKEGKNPFLFYASGFSLLTYTLIFLLWNLIN